MTFDELLYCIFSDSLGGIRYWADITGWSDTDVDEPGLLWYVKVVDVEDDNTSYTIDRAAILAGWELAATDFADRVLWSSSVPKPAALMTEDEVEDFDYDAGDADAIVQLGLFGKVIYG